MFVFVCDFSIDIGCSEIIRAFGAVLVYLSAILAISVIWCILTILDHLIYFFSVNFCFWRCEQHVRHFKTLLDIMTHSINTYYNGLFGHFFVASAVL